MSDIAAWVGSQPPLQSDPQYCCPDASIVLIAGNTLFRVHEWNILVFSGFFRAMAAGCGGGELESAGPIECDVAPAVLRHYLEIIYTGQHSQWSDLGPPFRGSPVPLIECRKLARRWDCRVAEDVTQAALDARIRLGAWGMFRLASQLDDTELGAECVAGFAAGRVPPDVYWWKANLNRNLLDGVSDAFLIELHTVIPAVQRVQSGTGTPWEVRPDWAEVSVRFFDGLSTTRNASLV